MARRRNPYPALVLAALVPALALGGCWRFAEAAHELSLRYDKPILTATELAVADPDNAGPRAVRATGRLCYASGNRAVTALGHLYQYAQFRERRGLS